MYYICVLRSLKNFNLFRSVHLNAKCAFKININQPKILFSTTRFPIDTINNLSKDVLLYTFERSKFYKYLSIFGIAQFCVWSFYGGLMYMTMKDISKEDLKQYEFFTKSPIWKYAFEGNRSYFIVIVLCISMGILSTAACTVLPSRIVKELTLCKGGKAAILVTYGPFGGPLKREVPLKNLSCVTSRSDAKNYLAVKVKPKWFYYLIDIRGKFHDPKLFDYTIGTRASRAY